MIRKEFKKIWQNKLLLLTVIVVSIIPILYASVFLKSIWDPYGNMDKLPVAVVNLDKSTNFEGKSLDVGNDLVSNLKNNKDLKWTFVSQDKAEKGLKNRKYYMVVTIPQNFSENAATVLNPKPKKMNLKYETNAGVNYLGEVVSDNAIKQLKSQVGEKVTESYASAILSTVNEMSQGIKTAASGSSKLSNGTQQVSLGVNKLGESVPSLSSGVNQLATGSESLTSGIKQYTSAVSQIANGGNQLSGGLSQLASQLPELSTGVQKLNTGASTLAKNLNQINLSSDDKNQLLTYINGVQTYLNEVNDSLSTIDLSQLSGLGQLPETFGEVSTNLTNVGTSLAGIQNGLQNAVSVDVQSNATAVISELAKNNVNLTSEQQEAVASALSDNTQNSKVIALVSQNLSTASTNLVSVSQTLENVEAQLQTLDLSSLSSSLSNLKSGTSLLAGKTAEASDGLTQAVNGLYKIKTEAGPGATSLSMGLGSLNSELPSLTAGISSLSSGSFGLSSGANLLNNQSGTLNNGSKQLSSGLTTLKGEIPSLTSGITKLQDGATQVNNGASELSVKLNDASSKIGKISLGSNNAKMIANPDKTTQTKYSSVPNYGHALAPYFMSVSLFVGCLVFNFVYPIRKIADRKNASAGKWYLSKITIGGIVSTAMALIIGTVMQWIGLDVQNQLQFYGILLVTAWSSMFLIMLLAMTFDNPGRFIAVILLVLQLGSSGGVFPMQIISQFYNVLHPFMPMTYAIYGLRQSISTGLGNSLYFHSLLILIIVTIGLLILLRFSMEFLFRKGLVGYSQLHNTQKLLDDDYLNNHEKYTLW